MKAKYFTSLGLVIGLLFSFLPQFVLVAFLQLQIGDSNSNIKTNGLNESWSLHLDYIPQALTIDLNNFIYLVEDDYSFDYLLKVVKYDTLGAILWNTHFEGFHVYYPIIKTDSNNNLYLACSYTNQTSQWPWRRTLFKFNSSGDIQWQRIWESENITHINDIAIDSEDNIYIYGTWESSDWTMHKIFIMKFNSTGDQLWYHIFEEGNTYIHGWDLEIDSDKNIIVSGSSYINKSIYWVRSYNISGGLQWSINSKFESFPLLALDSLDNVISIAWDYFNYDSHLILVKYDKIGNSIWNYTFESRFVNRLWQPIPIPMKYQFDLTLDSSDNIYIIWEIEIPNDLYTTDILLIKINNSGSFEWYLTRGGPETDPLISINLDLNDNIYLLSDHYLIKNPVSNGKSLYRTNLWNFLIILFGVFCFISLVSLYFIIKPKIKKISRK